MTASVRIQIFTIYKPILDPTELQGSEHPSQQNRFGLDRPWPRRIQGEKPYIEQGNSINPSEARLKLSLPATRRSKTKSTRARLYPRSARRRPSTSRARGRDDGGERRRTPWATGRRAGIRRTEPPARRWGSAWTSGRGERVGPAGR